MGEGAEEAPAAVDADSCCVLFHLKPANMVAVLLLPVGAANDCSVPGNGLPAFEASVGLALVVKAYDTSVFSEDLLRARERGQSFEGAGRLCRACLCVWSKET